LTLSESSRDFIELLAFIYLQHHRADDAAVLLELLAYAGGDVRLKGAAALAQLRANHPEKALRTIESLSLPDQLSPECQLLRAQSLFALDRQAEAASAMQAFVTARRQSTSVGRTL
jgi:predicted Zn-dependent protease